MSSSTTAAPPPTSRPRLSLPFPVRLILVNGATFIVGGALGATLGGHKAAMIFRAENAHRRPATAKGWYFYHKTKNYRTLYGGVVQGVRTALRMGVWVTAFVVLEDAVDRMRGKVDALASVAAGLSVAGAFSAWHRLSYGMAARTAKKGLIFGMLFGGIQDIVRWRQGLGSGVFGALGVGKEESAETIAEAQQ